MNSVVEINKLTSEIMEEVNEINQITDALLLFEPVSHKSQAKIQWNGGVIGAIKEHKEEKKLYEILNTKLYKDFSFYNIAMLIITKAEILTKYQLKIQQLINIKDNAYYENNELIIETINTCINAWYRFSPDAAEAKITMGEEKDVALNPTVRYHTNKAFAKLNLQEEYNYINEKAQKDNLVNQGSGCLGLILLFIVSSFSIMALVV